MLKRWIRRRYLGHPTRTNEEWLAWERDGYFMLMSRRYPIELWCAVDRNGVCFPQSIRGPDGLPLVRQWISLQPDPSCFDVVCLEARQAA